MSTLKNIYSKVYAISPKFVYLAVLEVIVQAVLPWIFILFPKYFFDMVQQHRAYTLILGYVLIVLCLQTCGNLGEIILGLKLQVLGEKLNFRLEQEVYSIIMDLPYQQIENPAILDLKNKALEGLTVNEQSGIIVFNKNIMNVFSAFLALLGVTYIVAKLNYMAMLVILVVVSLNFFIKRKLAQLEMRNWH